MNWDKASELCELAKHEHGKVARVMAGEFTRRSEDLLGDLDAAIVIQDVGEFVTTVKAMRFIEREIGPAFLGVSEKLFDLCPINLL